MGDCLLPRTVSLLPFSVIAVISDTKRGALRWVEIEASYFLSFCDSFSESNVGRWIPPEPQKDVVQSILPVYERHRSRLMYSW